jgi:SAM-dependent methyltransferase
VSELTVVRITSMSYTGTSWINLLLGCHPEAFALGPPDRLLRELTSGGEGMCLVHRGACSFWPGFCRAADPDRPILPQLAAHAGCRVIALNNPIPDGFGREIDRADARVVPVLIVRDGRAVTASHARHLKGDFQTSLREWYEPAMRGVVAWAEAERPIVIRHEDVLRDPVAALAPVGAAVGLTYGPDIRRYWTFGHHPIMANQGIVRLLRMHEGLETPGGDDDFYARQFLAERAGAGSGFHDDRWEAELGPADRAAFASVAGDLNARFGYTETPGVLDPRPESPPIETSASAASAGLVGDARRPRVPARRGLRRLLGGIRRRMQRTPATVGHAASGDGDASPPAAAGAPDAALAEREREIALITADFERLVAGTTDDDSFPASFAHFVRHYGLPPTILSYHVNLDGLVRRDRPRFGAEHGVDLGCWYGFSTLMLRRLGAARMTGLDVTPDAVEAARRLPPILELDGIAFDTITGGRGAGQGGTIPLPDASVDWVLANDVFSFADPGVHDALVAEAARILRPGGRFYLSDANNPHCPEAAARVRESWGAWEHGDGTAEHPTGSYQRVRESIIREAHPTWPADRIRDAARDTALRVREEILAYTAAGAPADAASRFDPAGEQPPIDPNSGRAIGAMTDPVALEAVFRRHGLTPELRFGYEGDPHPSREINLARCERFHLLGTRSEGDA